MATGLSLSCKSKPFLLFVCIAQICPAHAQFARLGFGRAGLLAVGVASSGDLGGTTVRQDHACGRPIGCSIASCRLACESGFPSKSQQRETGQIAQP